MDKLTPIIQATPLTPKSPENVSQWYTTEITVGIYTPSQAAYMHAQGWRTISIVTVGGISTYVLSRRIIKPENVLNALVRSYTDAYNEGRTLNDQRYDDIVTLFTTVLDRTEDSFNLLEADDSTYESLVDTLLANVDTDFASYDSDVTGDLDDWGTDQLAETNARFDAELSKAQIALIDRGMFSSALWVNDSAGIERDRSRALNLVNDTIEQRQLELKNKVYAEQKDVRTKILAARDRLRTFLHAAKDRQVALRNAAVEALAGIVERRTDGYPDLGEIGRLAASLGAGSAEAYSP